MIKQDNRQRLFEVMCRVDKTFKPKLNEEFVNELYTPTTDTRKIVSNEVSEEDIQKAEEITKRNVDPTWDFAKFGALIIGVTGKHMVYYTLWRYRPQDKYSPLSYMGNLATDIVRAAEKAKSIAGKQPILFDDYNTLKGLMGTPADIITFGKYRGKSLGEVYAEDPQWVIWAAKNFTPKNVKQDEFIQIAKDFSDTYFRSMTDQNRSAETKSQFGNVGETFEGDVIVNHIDFVKSEFGVQYKFKVETENHRFLFYIAAKALAAYLGIETEHEYIKSYDKYGSKTIETISNKTLNEINVQIPKLNNQTIKISGKIKDHKEIVGKVFTILNYVKLIKP